MFAHLHMVPSAASAAPASAIRQSSTPTASMAELHSSWWDTNRRSKFCGNSGWGGGQQEAAASAHSARSKCAHARG